ncbi:MAG: hypothetical protein HKUEN01_32280 [Candidatus Kuenenia stuttgartiensis]|nr:MAG: hypothetical protein HKUEN01_32280 [Candidatus Kuenenia stuttgartiensis]
MSKQVSQPNARVLIGVPSGRGEIKCDTVLGMYSLMAPVNTPSLDYASITIASNAMVHRARNKMIEQLLAEPEITHMLFLDDDMQPSPDALEKLLQADKDIIGGLCFTRRLPPEPTIYQEIMEGDKPLYRNMYNYPKDTVVKVDATGGAFLLVKRAVFEKLKPPYFFFEESAAGYGEDIAFCRKAIQEGFEVHVHTGAKVGHIGEFTYDEDAFIGFMHVANKDAAFGKKVGLTDEVEVANDTADDINKLLEEINQA